MPISSRRNVDLRNYLTLANDSTYNDFCGKPSQRQAMASARLMSAQDTGLLVVDVQDKLVPRIDGAALLVRNLTFLLEVAQLLDVPIQATEQYPKGLGSTVAPLLPFIPEAPAKLAFSSCAVASVLEHFERQARPKIVVVGIETHVCVLHTVMDLLERGLRVFVAVDAVGARYRIDHDVALRRIEQAGAMLTTVEGCAFEWMGGADHLRFKEISRLVQGRMAALNQGS